MPISVPPYMPIAPRDRPNLDIAGSISGLGDALQQGLEYGQKRKIDRATREAFAGGMPIGPDGLPDYMAAAGQILQGGGDMDTAMTLARLAETQTQNAYLRGRPQFMPGPGGSIYTEPTVAGEEPREVVPGTPPKRERPIVINDTAYDPDTMEPIVTAPPEIKAPKPLGTYEMKTIKEAEDAANAGDTTIKMLDEAISLNDKALSGPAAQQRGYAGSVLPDWAAPGSREAAVATEDLNNLVTRQALESLKAVFGSMPTEGERKILLEIQGSVNQSADVRKKIYQRAQELARKRVQENRETAAAVRNREYFSGNEEPVPGATENAGPAVPAEPASEPQGEVIETGDGRFMLMPDGTVIQLD